jgi:hypothetical protein
VPALLKPLQAVVLQGFNGIASAGGLGSGSTAANADGTVDGFSLSLAKSIQTTKLQALSTESARVTTEMFQTSPSLVDPRTALEAVPVQPMSLVASRILLLAMAQRAVMLALIRQVVDLVLSIARLVLLKAVRLVALIK